MKKTLHWINIIICFLLLGLGIIMIVYGGSSAEINTDTGIFRLMGIDFDGHVGMVYWSSTS